MKFYLFILLSIVFLLSSCKSSSEPDPSGGTTGEITFTEITDLPNTGGNVTGVGYLPGNTLATIIDGKLYEILADGTPRLVNADAGHMTVYIAPDGSAYVVMTDNSLRRYDMTAGTFVTLPAVNPAPQGSTEIRFRFSATKVFYTYIDKFGYGEAMYSSDNGATFTKLPFTDGHLQNDIAIAPNGDVLSVSSSPSSTQLLKTTDLGITWTSLCTYPVNYLGTTLFFASNADIYSFSVAGNSMYVSHDAGKTFSTNTWLPTFAYTRAMAEGQGGTIYVIGGRDITSSSHTRSGLMKSTDRGATWTNILLCDGNVVSTKANMISVGSSRGILMNEGTTWTQRGLPVDLTPADIALDKNGDLLLASGNTLYRKKNGMWNVLASPGGITKINVNKRGDIVCAPGMIYSNDNGALWNFATVTGLGIEVRSVTSNSANDFFAGTARYNTSIDDYTEGELLKSTDGGASFNPIFSQHNFTRVIAGAGSELYGIWQYELAGHNSDGLQSGNSGLTWSAYTGKYFPLAFNSGGNYISNHGVSTGFQMYFVNKGSGDTKDMTTSIKTGRIFVQSLIFDSNDKIYTLLLQGDLGKYSIYVSKDPIK